ncbi:hypothetical protein M3G00_11145 [Brevibacterium casei]|uniref:Uncharacterized protein n=1 Tax=Brevibacterium casei TaxID=33889 RepID=A0A7T2TG34_9MICO|nr:hypothetical protein [Brevibacterium casei]MCT1551118.1 hypothetical protein [Brevibacterium casei]MCT1561046.1 hypothetical protein [Brevibacterium casei]MCT2183490.1 hypothetical protein [Brevibacterium casei]MCT2209362.1 hypothetical protein [Brevibacterium casei]QPS33159.1 hypothetical protein I6G59_14545 [Brevibacterium casei]
MNLHLDRSPRVRRRVGSSRLRVGPDGITLAYANSSDVQACLVRSPASAPSPTTTAPVRTGSTTASAVAVPPATGTTVRILGTPTTASASIAVHPGDGSPDGPHLRIPLPTAPAVGSARWRL